MARVSIVEIKFLTQSKQTFFVVSSVLLNLKYHSCQR